MAAPETRSEIPRWGDRVELKSGGPVMLVVGLNGHLLTCAWPQGERDFQWVALRKIDAIAGRC